MSFPIESIHIQNSFAHVNTKIKFKPGKNYIIGPNGSGKSEILELIGFAFFGSAALRDVRTNYKKLKVEIIFNFGGSRFKIIRSISDVLLYIENDNKFVQIVNSNTYVNNKIIGLLGYDLTVYKLSNYCEQDELQYISKMGPAKRIQFIDKVSGIDDAKELFNFLEARRKLLVSETNLLKKLLIAPATVGDDILLVDYQKLLDDLDTEILNTNTLVTRLAVLETKVTMLSKKPVIASYYNPLYGELTQEKLDNIIDYLQRLTIAEKELDLAHIEVKKIPVIAKEYENVTLDDIHMSEIAIKNNKDLVIKNSLMSAGQTECPNCNHIFHNAFTELTKYSEITEYVQPRIPEEHIISVKNYLIKDKQILDNLKINVRQKAKNYTSVLGEDVGFENASLLTVREITQNYQINKSLLDDYNHKLNSWNIEVLNKEHDQREIEVIKRQLIDSNLDHLFKTKEDLIRNQTIKNRYIAELESYIRSKTLFDELMSELTTIVEVLRIVKESTETIKENSIPLINYHASLLLNQMTNGEMCKIQVLDNYDILVDGYDIKLKSGSEKDIASLAFRLSLGNSVIPGMMKLFIGDEIDHSSTIERTEYITEALDKLGDNGYQLILVTHKSLENIESGNIIDLSKL